LPQSHEGRKVLFVERTISYWLSDKLKRNGRDGIAVAITASPDGCRGGFLTACFEDFRSSIDKKETVTGY